MHSEFGETPSSAGLVSFMFSWALLGYFNKYLSIMAAISLISDMMPLVSYNRDFLRLVFSSYKDGEFYRTYDITYIKSPDGIRVLQGDNIIAYGSFCSYDKDNTPNIGVYYIELVE